MTYALEALGWGVLHGVWIAPILVGAGALALAVLRNAAPAARYGVALAVLAAVAVVPWGIGGYVYLEYAEHLDWVARNAGGRTPVDLHALHYSIYVHPLSGGTAGALEALAVGAALFWLASSLRGLVALGCPGGARAAARALTTSSSLWTERRPRRAGSGRRVTARRPPAFCSRQKGRAWLNVVVGGAMVAAGL